MTHHNGEESNNNSGQPDATLPPALRRFSWAGFWGSWIWALGNGAWIGLWGLVPCVGFIVRFVLGDRGNEWAWRHKKWDSVEQFRRIQKEQALIGFGLSLFSWFLCIVLIYPIFGRARDSERKSSCQSNLRQISLGWKQYAQDYNGTLPPGKTVKSWNVALQPYLKSQQIFICPQVINGEESYDLNPRVSGANLDRIESAELIPILFDTRARHYDHLNAAFADGHVKAYDPSEWDSKILPRMRAFVPDKSPSKD